MTIDDAINELKRLGMEWGFDCQVTSYAKECPDESPITICATSSTFWPKPGVACDDPHIRIEGKA